MFLCSTLLHVDQHSISNLENQIFFSQCHKIIFKHKRLLARISFEKRFSWLNKGLIKIK